MLHNLKYKKERKKLEEQISKVRKLPHKILLIYDDELLITMLNTELLNIISYSENHTMCNLALFFPPPVSLNKKIEHLLKSGRMVPFPYPLPAPLTVKECKEIILDEIKIYAKPKIDNKDTITLFFFFTNFTAGNIVDDTSQKNFVEAIIELSKKFVMILPDPRNKFGLIPIAMMSRLHLGGSLGSRPNAVKFFMSDFLSKATIINLFK